MSDNTVPDVLTPPPTGDVNKTKLMVYLNLYGPPVWGKADDSAEKGPIGYRTTFQFALEISAEEAGRLRELVSQTRAAVIQAEESDGKTYSGPLLLPTHTG